MDDIRVHTSDKESVVCGMTGMTRSGQERFLQIS